jgi:hypothetical protein
MIFETLRNAQIFATLETANKVLQLKLKDMIKRIFSLAKEMF